MSAEDEYAPARAAMMDEVSASIREVSGLTGIQALSEPVFKAMSTVPRERFVLPDYQHVAYRNTPLPIADGQTISQPLIVALMTELLAPQTDDIILEVGTGSGYQAAVLSQLVKQVYSVEIFETLAASAAQALVGVGYNNVEVRAGDGYAGWPEHAPFDGIIVTAAAPEIPPPLLQQLKPGARLVIPVNVEGGHQDLLVIEVNAAGEISKRSVLPVRFVPLTRDR